jgi:hypothetical protein
MVPDGTLRVWYWVAVLALLFEIGRVAIAG